MTSLRDQFSAVRKAQFEAQFDFFNSMTNQALESASRVAALNLAASRDAVQRSIGASFALMNSRDPRDVLGFSGQAEEQMRSLFAYGRELLGIASGVRPYSMRPQALAQPQVSGQAIETVEVIERGAAEAVSAAAETAAASAESVVETAAASAEAVVETAAAPTEATAAAVPAAESVAEVVVEATPAAEPAPASLATAEPAEPLVVAEPETAPEPLAVVAEPVPVPVAEPKAIAKAAGKGAARAAAAPHPAAAPLTAVASEDVDAPKPDTPQVSSRRKK